MAKGRHKPPSRIKYEQNNPTISFRVSREVHDKLKDHLARRRVSFADFVKESLGTQQLKLPDVGKIRLAAWNEGYAKAAKEYKIWYYCTNCKKAIVIKPNSEAHKDVIEDMETQGWHHTECP